MLFSLLTTVLYIILYALFALLAASAHCIVDFLLMCIITPRFLFNSDWFNTRSPNSYSSILFLVSMCVTEHLLTLNSICHSCDHLYNLCARNLANMSIFCSLEHTCHTYYGLFGWRFIPKPLVIPVALLSMRRWTFRQLVRSRTQILNVIPGWNGLVAMMYIISCFNFPNWFREILIEPKIESLLFV